MDELDGPVHGLYASQLAAAQHDLAGAALLPRRDPNRLRLLVALLVLDGAFAAIPNDQAPELSPRMTELREFIVRAEDAPELAADDRRSLEDLREAKNEEELRARLDRVWQERRLELDEILARLEAALDNPEKDEAGIDKSLDQLRRASAGLDADEARKLGEKLCELAARKGVESRELDELAAGLSGSGAGLGGESAGLRPCWCRRSAPSPFARRTRRAARSMPGGRERRRRRARKGEEGFP